MTTLRHLAASTVRRAAACLAALALVTAAGSPAAAAFGPRVTAGDVYQQTSNTTSPDGLVEGVCTGLSVCHFLFQTVPNGQDLVIEHLSCRLIPTAGEIYEASLETRRGNQLQERRTILIPKPTPIPTLFLINSTALHPIKATQRAVVKFFNSSAARYAGECTISGRLVTP
jgi:hypothetical protein